MKKKRSKFHRFVNLFVFGIVSGLVMYYVSVVLLTIFGLTSTAHRSICCETPNDYGLGYEDISFTSQDGTRLFGWYIPPQNGTVVILLHGFGDDRRSMLDVAAMLAAHGYGSVMYDLRGHGESHSEFRSGGWQDVDDVAALLDYLDSGAGYEFENVAILGFSVGGQVAIHAAAELDTITAVIADGPGNHRGDDMPHDTGFSRFDATVTAAIIETGVRLRTGVSPPSANIDVIADIAPRPILLIAGGQTMRNLEERIAKRYYEFAEEPKELWLNPDAGHIEAFYKYPEAYETRVVTFFDSAVER